VRPGEVAEGRRAESTIANQCASERAV
jgi:hypothetical protein